MNENRLIDDCFLHDKDRLQHEDALTIIRKNVARVVSTEDIAASLSLGRITAEDIKANHPVPMHRNAAVDGYAFNHRDLNDAPLPVAQTIAAGDTNIPPLATGTAARIFTGAAMPDGADSVAMQEDCALTKDLVRLPLGLKAGANCRQAGEDLRGGDVAIAKNTRLKPAHLAALASVGCGRLSVFEKLRVTLISSGNELRNPTDNLGPLVSGQVWDANAPMLQGLLDKFPVTIIKTVTLADDRKQVIKALKDAAQTSDLILSTGGASRGREDHMLDALDTLGKRHMWRLAIKPGRPMMFGQIAKSDGSDCVFLGLPGNPVAAMVCFLLYGREVLLRLAGENPKPVHSYKIPANFSVSHKKPDRREFLRGMLQTDDDGNLTVDKFDRDGSGLISSLTQADGLIEIDETTTTLPAGSLMRFLPFSSFE